MQSTYFGSRVLISVNFFIEDILCEKSRHDAQNEDDFDLAFILAGRSRALIRCRRLKLVVHSLEGIFSISVAETVAQLIHRNNPTSSTFPYTYSSRLSISKDVLGCLRLADGAFAAENLCLPRAKHIAE
jgi:hypothetical protein